MASSILRLVPCKWAVGSPNRTAVPGSSNRIFNLNILGGRRISTAHLISNNRNSHVSSSPSNYNNNNNVLGIGSDDDGDGDGDGDGRHKDEESNLAAASPWLMLPPPESTGQNSMGGFCTFYSIRDEKVISVAVNTHMAILTAVEYVGSSHGWLAAEYGWDQYLYNPLSGRRIDLPPIDNLPVSSSDDDGNYNEIRKLILSCSPDDDDDDDCIAMMSYNWDERLAYCRPNRSKEWTPIGKTVIELDDKTFPRAYQDFVYSAKRKLFFCLTGFGNLEAWDLHGDDHPTMTHVWSTSAYSKGMVLSSDRNNYPWGSAGKIDKDCPWMVDECLLKREFPAVKYLVEAEQTGQLFLVRRYVSDRPFRVLPPDRSHPYMTVSFDVYEIDLEKRELRYMESSLNGLAFFIGLNHGFAIVKEKLSPDSIYFTDAKEYTPPYMDIDSVYGGHDIGVFDYVNRDFSACYFPIEERSFCLYRPHISGAADEIKRLVPPPIWFTPSAPPLL